MLLDRVGIVLVTSPARSHPSTDMVWGALGSTSLLGGLASSQITVVCDGYRTPTDLEPEHAERVTQKLSKNAFALSKRGIVTTNTAEAYQAYQHQLQREVDERGLAHRISVKAMRTHQGFALCVRSGLLDMQRRGLDYALVIQHDRGFIRCVPREDMELLVRQFDVDTTTRYIGFASSTSKLLATRLGPKYRLGHLLERRSRQLREGLYLRPSIFWFDSNHLVHVSRCLNCLYEPFTHAPPNLRAHCAATRPAGIGTFTLRRGDFIEDRFGTEQKAVLTSLCAAPEQLLLEAFDFFGSYLVEEVVDADACDAEEDESSDGSGDDLPANVCTLLDAHGRVSHVAHMDARGARPRAWLSQLPTL